MKTDDAGPGSGNIKLYILFFTSIITLAVTVFSLLSGITIVFPHLYYIPIILCAYWFPKRGIAFALGLGIIYLFLVFALTAVTDQILVAALIRAIVFVGVGAVVSFLAMGLKWKDLEYRSIFENTGTATFITNRDTEFLMQNNEIEDIFGLSGQELEGRRWIDFAPEEEQPRLLALNDQWFSNPASAPRKFETRLNKEDGNLRDVFLTIGRIGDAGNLVISVQDITKIRATERNLKESEERFAQIIDFLPDATFAIDREGKVIAWNNAIEKLTSIRSEDILGKGDFEYSIPFFGCRKPSHIDFAVSGEVESSNRRFPDTAENCTQLVGETDFSRFPGNVSMNWGWTIASPLFDSEGRVVGAVQSIRDISERKKMEELLLEEKERLNVTLHSIGDGVIVTDMYGSVVMLNKVAEKLSGWMEEDAKGKPLGTVFHIINEKTGEICENPVEKVLESGQIIGLANHTALISRNGDIYNIADSAAPILDCADEVIGVVLVFRDVTEEKKAEEARLTLASIVTSSNDAIIRTTKDGFISSWNRGAEQIYGYPAGEIIGSHPSVLAPPERSNEFNDIIRQILKGEQVEHFETRRKKKTGEDIFVSITVSPLLDEDGEIIGFSTISQDITERRKAEEQLEKYARDLKIRNEELEQFAYVASHDLQEPLRMVTSFVQLLQRRYEGKLDADADEFIYYAVDGANRMQLLINDLLAFSRVNTRGNAFIETDSNDVLKKTINDLQIQIKESNAAITCDPLPIVVADQSQLAQVFQNLLSNALKFKTDVPPRIHVSAHPEDGEWVFSVKDNGIGIDPEYFNRIFVIFKRLHSRSEYPGTGIGLAICKRIMDRHGGRIWVESEPGMGSTFFFTIPADGTPQ